MVLGRGLGMLIATIGRWFAFGIAAAAVLLVTLVLYHDSYEKRQQPRFYDVELRPGMVCIFDRLRDEVVPDTCREAQL